MNQVINEPLLYIIIINTFLCMAAILIHFEILSQLTTWVPRIPCSPRLRILIGLFGAIAGHIIEIWFFAFGYYFLHHSGKFGHLQGVVDGSFHGTLLDCSYFSFVTYTSVGFGDIFAIGDIRYLTGLEALIGLVLITWTASFMFIEMQKFWLRSPGANRQNNP